MHNVAASILNLLPLLRFVEIPISIRRIVYRGMCFNFVTQAAAWQEMLLQASGECGSPGLRELCSLHLAAQQFLFPEHLQAHQHVSQGNSSDDDITIQS